MHFTFSRAFLVVALLDTACTEANPFGPASDGSASSSSSPSTSSEGGAGSSTALGDATTQASNSGSIADESSGPTTSASDTSSTSGTGGTTATADSSSSSGPALLCEQDGEVGEGETCDDDNPFAGDGCTDCQVEDGWACAFEPSQCSILCDPLLQDCEGADLACYPITDEAEVWVCSPDASGEMGEFGDPCEYVNVCDPGLACVDPGFFETCSAPSGCCSPLCNLDDPECPIRWTCISYYDGAPVPGYENIGICAWL